MMNKHYEFKKVWPSFLSVFTAVLFVMSLMGMGGYGFADEGNAMGKEISKIEQIKKAGKIVVGTSADYPPYEFHPLGDKEADLIGIDIDIAKVIAKELGVKLEIKDLIFSRIFDALNAGKIDIAIAGLNPSEARQEMAVFSDVYYQAIQSIVMNKQEAERIKTVEDLRGKRIGVQRDSLQESLGRSQIHNAEFDVRETIEELVIILSKGLVDAIILEEPVADSYVRMNKNFVSIKCEHFDKLLGSAIAVKKGNNDLLAEINRILTSLKEDGRIAEFVENAKVMTNKK